MYDVYIGPLGPFVRNLSSYTGCERQNFWNDNLDPQNDVLGQQIAPGMRSSHAPIERAYRQRCMTNPDNTDRL